MPRSGALTPPAVGAALAEFAESIAREPETFHRTDSRRGTQQRLPFSSAARRAKQLGLIIIVSYSRICFSFSRPGPTEFRRRRKTSTRTAGRETNVRLYMVTRGHVGCTFGTIEHTNESPHLL